jgi:transposase-like protein
MDNKNHRPEIQTLACPYSDCQLYAQKAAGNLCVRKVYGKDRIRYLRCRSCAREFSERKGTALFNTKVAEHKAISVAEHLAEGVSTKGTSRLVGVSAEAARRMNAYLIRKSLAFARKEQSREGLGWWSAVVYNFCRAQRGLRVPLCVSEGRRRYEWRTPTMAANLTDFIWTVADVLRTPVYPAGGAR